MIAELSIIPIGKGKSLSKYMAKKEKEAIHEIVKCKGVDMYNNPVLKKTKEVIVIKYKDGTSLPCCEYLSNPSGMCDIKEIDKEERGMCVFYKK